MSAVVAKSVASEGTSRASFDLLHENSCKEDFGLMEKTKRCSGEDCAEGSIAVLEGHRLCFDHFCGHCYKLLERADGGLDRCLSPEQLTEQLEQLEECAKRALEISFVRQKLRNLERARLLDILLWSGDLTIALRRRQRHMSIKSSRDFRAVSEVASSD